ncbi:MAG: outer membrane lipoprotein carrier protein LolA [Deltaproteobacteria bacterium]|nr:outer membrane lipoprotein carrier protein LolA [Deltaproteobacteria bacterium]
MKIKVTTPIWLLVSAILALSAGAVFAAGENNGKPPATVLKTQLKKVATATVDKDKRDAILKRIRQKFNRPEAWSGYFTQTTTYADSDETAVASGRILIQGPDKMRWEYEEPEKQLLVSDGKTVWYYTPDLNQVMTGAVKDIREARIIISLLAEIKSRIKGFDLTVEENEKQVMITLRPEKGAESPPFESLRMIFARPSLNLMTTELVDLFANRITIAYRWTSGPDPALPRARFMFVPPPGCDVMPLGQ